MPEEIDTSFELTMGDGAHSFRAVVTACDTFGGCASATSNVVTVPEEASVGFTSAKSVADVQAWAAQANVWPAILQSSYTFFGGTRSAPPYVWTIFYVVDPTIGNVPSDYVDEVPSGLQDAINAWNTLDPPANVATETGQLNTIKTAISGGQIQVTRTLVQGSTSALAALSSNPSVSSVSRQSDMIAAGAQNDPLANDAGSTCAGPWPPDLGAILTRASWEKPASRRFVAQRFSWNSTRFSHLKSCRSGSLTYEQQFWECNYQNPCNRRHYLGKRTRTLSTDLPHPFLHVRLGESRNELSYAIGTADAKALFANRRYHTFMQTHYGNASTGSGKIFGKRGHLPGSCFILTPSWCNHTDAFWVIMPAWTVSEPGILAWST